jgi:hypothetical protein
MLSHFFFIRNNFFNNIWCGVMTIYTGYILLGKSYQYDMNVVHYRRHDMYALSIYIKNV